MYKFVSPKDKALERAEQMKGLNFDWFDRRPATSEKIAEYADIIYERVSDQVQAYNPIDLLFSTQQGELGKRLRFKETFGARVYHRTYGEYKKSSPIKSTFYTISTSPKSLHLAWPVEDIKAGIILTSEMVEMATKAILYFRMKIMWDTLKDAVVSTNSVSYSSFTGNVPQSTLSSAINGLADYSAVQAIIGRRSLLAPIITFTGYDNATGYSDEVKQQIHNTGWLTTYIGNMVIGLEAFEDDLTGSAAIDDDNIFVIGSKTKNWNRWVEVSPLSQAIETKPEDGSFHIYYDFEDGFAVWKTKYIRRIEKTS
jgi:hypothetical protein